MAMMTASGISPSYSALVAELTVTYKRKGTDRVSKLTFVDMPGNDQTEEPYGDRMQEGSIAHRVRTL